MIWLMHEFSWKTYGLSLSDVKASRTPQPTTRTRQSDVHCAIKRGSNQLMPFHSRLTDEMPVECRQCIAAGRR